MSKFSSKLARYNTICCEQVMPVPVIPVCAVSCCLPRPICEINPQCLVPPQQDINQSTENIPIQETPLQIQNYCPGLDPAVGSILTISSSTIPSGYLALDGSEISRILYTNLFLVIGTYYGDGDGTTTFNLPNLLSDNSSDYVVPYIIKT